MDEAQIEKYVGDGTEFEVIEESLNFPQCIVCQHLLDAETEKCKAFPNGIPEKFFMGDKAHDKLINGFKFEPIPEIVEV